MLLIIDISTDLSQISLKVYKYDSNLDVALPSQTEYISTLESTSPSGTQAYATFVDIANKTEMIYKKPANKEEKGILKAWAKKMVELLWGTKFPLQGFKLDYKRTLLIVAEVVDTISLKYGRLSIWAKIKFHVEQLKVEITHLKMLTSQSCYYITEIELKLKYI